ncbi:MAG: hypothetical protein NDI61_11005 [Bdellovibrionaceae bacterium]|nr:hypothetical protein [Pseudobdellovibrionaceae bacterium]
MAPQRHARARAPLDWTRLLFFVASCAVCAASPTEVVAQEQQASAYFSQTDADLTIRKVAIFPVTDNLDGIYARPIEGQLTELIKTYHQWDLAEPSSTLDLGSPADLEESPDEVRRIGAGVEADAFLVTKVSKGPNGVTIKLNLFMKHDGKLLVQEILKDHPRFEVNELKAQVKLLFAKLVRRIPYDGLILSRQGNRVTLNLGASDGLAQNQMVTVVQIIKTNRHPKFNFLVSTEKEILGRVKILKIEDTMSFGAVISELDKGVIRKFHKISGLDQVSYPEPDELTGTGEGGSSLLDRDDSQISFGKNPNEWVPVRPPAFGAVGLKAGFGTYNVSMALTSENLEAKSSLYPSIGIFGELWLNQNWTVRAELEQGVGSTSNPKSGSTPSELNHQLTKYSLMMVYNFLLRDDFFGPKLQVRTGFTRYQVFVDDSTPTAFTTTTYSGLLLGLYGSLPVTEKKDWYVGAGLNMVMFPGLEEKPVSSAATDKNSINDFTLWVEKKLSENLHATASLDFSLYSTSFTGTGTRSGESATSLSQRHQRLTGGIIYMF